MPVRFDVGSVPPTVLQPTSYIAYDPQYRNGGCIDPRATQGVDQQPIMIMSPGGHVGDRVDRAIAGIKTNDGISGILPGAHHGCAYAANLGTILSHQVMPGQQALADVETWAARYGIGEKDIVWAAARAGRLARRVLAYSGRQQWTDQIIKDLARPDIPLEAVIDGLAQHGVTVSRMVGDGKPQYYVVNHTPTLLDRPAVHGSPTDEQAYHDNVGLSVELILRQPGLSPLQRRRLIAARLMRAAATRAVINGAKTAANQTLSNYEIVDSPSGGVALQEVPVSVG